MRFEEGKYYRHNSGNMMHIVGRAMTTGYGECLIREETNGADLVPIGEDEDAAQNWVGVSRADWLHVWSIDPETMRQLPESRGSVAAPTTPATDQAPEDRCIAVCELTNGERSTSCGPHCRFWPDFHSP